MANKIYALLVGINDYSPEIGRLAGCLNDVDHFKDYLTGAFKQADLAIEVLKDGEATRDNIIKLFRAHLGKAKGEDVAVFQYCGHGARWAAAKEFKEFYPEGKDEGLVCHDSRRKDGTYPHDLADKELAVLLAEVAANAPHLAVILDCCHSGSATRDVDAFTHLKARQTHEVSVERPLDSYLDGHYAKLRQQGKPLSIARSKHILLAACDRKEKAYEARDRSGLFTSTLLKTLEKSGSDINYADLFVRCRAEIRKEADNQTPQFETSENFNAFSGFLGRKASHTARRHSVYFKDGNWTIDAGALHGLPTEPEKSIGLALYPEEDQSRLAGHASTIQVGPQKSQLKLDFAGDQAVRYHAEVTSLPVAPIPVHIEGDENGKTMLRKALNPSMGVDLTDIAEGTRYAICAQDGVYMLKQRELDLVIQGVKGLLVRERSLGKEVASYSEESAQVTLGIVKQIAQWERSLALQNHGTKLDTAKVDFVYAEQLDNGQEHVYPAGEIILDFVKSGKEWREIRGKFKARNRTEQTLHFILAYFSDSYGIHILRNEPVPPGKEYVTLWGEDEKDYFYLEDNVNESLENFKLIVSTEQVDDFLLSQDDLELGKIISSFRAVGTIKPMKKMVHENEWFTKSIRAKVVRQLDQVGVKDAALAKGKIVVKSHPAVKANLSLSAAKAPARSVGAGTDFYKAFERQGLEMLNFAGTRGDNESILELTDIENAEALAQNPLEIDVNVTLSADEGILPLIFDGQHVLLGGDTYKDEQGNTHISIDHIPEVPDNRRSVGKALKLYFFKTYLKQDSVNQLRWLEYKADGTMMRHKTAIADKVNAAQNVVVLVHGLIGDTENIAKGLRMIDAGGASLDQKFDLVLTYDYENLSTPMAETALDLKKKLEAAGFGANDNKKLTLLAHSMGGLVARWFIEREGGNTMVDHLVMCGTPNHGSPFGKIDAARKILNVLTGVAMNYLPALIPFNGAIMFLLNRSKKITPTLEQLNASSEFIATLNSSGDPGLRYTILAGDVEAYQEPSDQFFRKLLAKAGKGFAFSALFGSGAHDLAAGVESILGIDGARNPLPRRENVACHHLNYFVSEAGQKALAGVEW
ncbi:MAG: caspase family protein [bacterium]